jgi:hypothetical protein
MIITLYDKLKARNYKTFKVCQFPGCDKPLKRLFSQKVKKYCSLKHALEAQKLYRSEWNNLNRDRIREYNHRYATKRRKKIQSGELNLNQNAVKKTYSN